MYLGRFVENIPKHITGKSGFDSMAEYIQCVQEGTIRLAATRDIQAGEEIFVRHAPGDIQWDCFHPAGCTSGTVTLSLLLIIPTTLTQKKFLCVDAPYDLYHCVQCKECFRGIHISCLRESEQSVSCSSCTAAVKKAIFTDQVLSPSVR